MIVDVLIARFPGKREEPQAKHVERGQSSSNQRHDEQEEMCRVALHKCQGRCHNGIFGKVTGKGKYRTPVDEPWNREATDCNDANKHGEGRDGHLSPQPTHLRHFLFVMASVDHAARTQEHE